MTNLYLIDQDINHFVNINKTHSIDELREYYRIVGVRAANFLDKLAKIKSFTGINLTKFQLLTKEENDVLVEAINYLLEEGDDVSSLIDVFERTQLIEINDDLEEVTVEEDLPVNRFTLFILINEILSKADVAYAAKLNFWDLYYHRKSYTHFTKKLNQSKALD